MLKYIWAWPIARGPVGIVFVFFVFCGHFCLPFFYVFTFEFFLLRFMLFLAFCILWAWPIARGPVGVVFGFFVFCGHFCLPFFYVFTFVFFLLRFMSYLVTIVPSPVRCCGFLSTSLVIATRFPQNQPTLKWCEGDNMKNKKTKNNTNGTSGYRSSP
jgi:hypothetical protein